MNTSTRSGPAPARPRRLQGGSVGRLRTRPQEKQVTLDNRRRDIGELAAGVLGVIANALLSSMP